MIRLRKALAALLTAVVLTLLTAVGCHASDSGFEAYNGKKIGVMTGTAQEKYVREKIPDAVLQYYSSYSDMALATVQGRCDAFAIPGVSMKPVLQDNPSLVCHDEALAYDDIGFIFPKSEKGDTLREEFNAFLEEYRASGAMEADMAEWFEGELPENPEPVDFSDLSAENGVLRYGTITIVMPFCYKSGDGFLGYDMGLIHRFCEEYGYGIKMEDAQITSVLAGVETGTYDLGGGAFAVTDERKEKVNFSDSYYESPQMLVYHDPAAGERVGFFASLKDRFRNTLITENRWKLIFSGLMTTLFVSVCAFLLATAVGAGLCAMMLSKNSLLNKLAAVYHRIMQGVPVVVILMIFYYVFLARLKASGLLVSVIVFGLHSASGLGELFRGGVLSVKEGETEAAAALGLTKGQVFRGVVFPQAMRSVAVGYRSALINLIMATSVVGYIAVEDLTKASDIIRGRTFDAFLPLITTAVLYFLITFAVTCLITLILTRTDPKAKRDRARKKAQI